MPLFFRDWPAGILTQNGAIGSPENGESHLFLFWQKLDYYVLSQISHTRAVKLARRPGWLGSVEWQYGLVV